MRNPSGIRNKAKRTEVYAKYKLQKKKLKKKLRSERIKENEALGDKAPPKQIPTTIENTREVDDTLVRADDEEIAGDEQDDEFADFYNNTKEPQLEGRQVVTFHNQRDFIFVRHHRYVYRKEKVKTRARLQELGPRFTLKLKWLQEGTFNTKFGEFEWIQRRKTMETSRKKFVI